MAKEVTLEEAMKVINEYPSIDSFVSENCQAHAGMHNEYYDNSVELAEYYSKCEKIVNQNKETK